MNPPSVRGSETLLWNRSFISPWCLCRENYVFFKMSIFVYLLNKINKIRSQNTTLAIFGAFPKKKSLALGAVFQGVDSLPSGGGVEDPPPLNTLPLGPSLPLRTFAAAAAPLSQAATATVPWLRPRRPLWGEVNDVALPRAAAISIGGGAQFFPASRWGASLPRCPSQHLFHNYLTPSQSAE